MCSFGGKIQRFGQSAVQTDEINFKRENETFLGCFRYFQKNPVFVLDLWLFCFLVCYGQTLNKFRYFFQVNWTCGTHCRKTSWAVICEIFHVTSMLSFHSEKRQFKNWEKQLTFISVLKSLIKVSFYKSENYFWCENSNDKTFFQF